MEWQGEPACPHNAYRPLPVPLVPISRFPIPRSLFPVPYSPLIGTGELQKQASVGNDSLAGAESAQDLRLALLAIANGD